MTHQPEITTARCQLRLASEQDVSLLLNYYLRNQQHLAPWEPVRAASFYTKEQFREKIQQSTSAWKRGSAFHFIAVDNDSGKIIGICNFSNIVRGAFQACHLGYSICHHYQGKELMYEILSASIDYMFTEQNLHRIMANYIPDNKRSASLLKRLGFEEEGYARDYLFIAGRWQDHVLTARINSEYLIEESS